MNKKILLTFVSIVLLLGALIGTTYLLTKNKPIKPLSTEEYLTKFHEKPNIPSATISAKIDTMELTKNSETNKNINYANFEVFIDYPSFVILNPDLADKKYFRNLYAKIETDGTFNFGNLPAGRKVMLIITDYDQIYTQKMVDVPQTDTNIGSIKLSELQ